MGRGIDYLIIACYLIGIAIFGALSGGKQKSAKDYFLGAKDIPWWIICFAIVATETSTLTFISIPGLSYVTGGNLNFLQITIGYLIGRIVVAFVLLPRYYKGELSTAYAFLEERFGVKTRSFASIVFLFTRVAADGVRLFATAIPLKFILNINYPTAIMIIALVTLLFTYIGGVKGVLWVDSVQMFIYLGGAILAGCILVSYIPGGFAGFVQRTAPLGKLTVINLGFDKGFAHFFSNPYTLLAGILGGAFLSMASHGTDQLIVQRLLAAKNLRDSKKAIIGSGLIIIVQFAIFLLVGVALYAYYGPLKGIKGDEVFVKFIVEKLPVGVSGIIIAGLFASAMSTLAGSITSLSSSSMMDLYRPYIRKNRAEDTLHELRVSRMLTVFWASLLVVAAIAFMHSSSAVIELALSIASFTYGGLLGTFLLGILVKKARQRDALVAFSSGIIIMSAVILLKLVAWTWFTIIGVIATVSIGYLMSRLPMVSDKHSLEQPERKVGYPTHRSSLKQN